MAQRDAMRTKLIGDKGFLVNHNFAFLWAGQAISNVGDFVFNTTLVLWIGVIIAAHQPWAPLAVSGVLVAIAIPTLVIRPIAGVFVDRWDKRATMLWMDGLRAALIGVLCLTSGWVRLPFIAGGHLSDSMQLASIYLIVFLSTTCSQFFSPAQYVLIGDIVPEHDLPRASGLSQITTNLAIMIGPSLAGPLVFGFGVQWVLIGNAISFLVSFMTILQIPSPQRLSQHAEETPRFFAEFSAGIQIFLSNQVLRTMGLSLVVAMLGLGSLFALDVFFVTENLHASPAYYGLLDGVFGAGSIIGSVIITRYIDRIGLKRTFWLSMVAVGLLLVIFARMTHFIPALIVFFLLGIPNAASNVAMQPLILLSTPRDYVGRATSILVPIYTAAIMISEALAGFLDSTVLPHFHSSLLGVTLGPVDLIFMVSGILVVIGGFYAKIGLHSASLSSVS